MCRAGRFLTSFSAGTSERPSVPAVVEACLTPTMDNAWVVWGRKVARAEGSRFKPLTPMGGEPYPWDAVARCHRKRPHTPPQHGCTCGFHALSVMPELEAGVFPKDSVLLDVALWGRILVLDSLDIGGLLFRAERQTVLRVERVEGAGYAPPAPARRNPLELRRSRVTRRPSSSLEPLPPPEPGGSLARLRRIEPYGSGPIRLRMPQRPPASVVVEDDPGLCAGRLFNDQPTRSGSAPRSWLPNLLR